MLCMSAVFGSYHNTPTWHLGSGGDLETTCKFRAHHIGSTIHRSRFWASTHVDSPSTAALSEIGRGGSRAACFGRENELVACMGAHFNLAFGPCLPHWSGETHLRGASGLEAHG